MSTKNSEVGGTESSQPSPPEAGGWNDSDWKHLLLSITHKQCTPFLGAGACAGVLPMGADIAEELAKEYGYPFDDRRNLIRVAQYVAVMGGAHVPKLKILEKFRDKGPPDFSNECEPHRAVADLDLPVYITTNYDDFMFRALERDVPPRTPHRVVCPWHVVRRRDKVGKLEPFDPAPDRPVVFHLHGHLSDPHSLVVTEDDYLDFLMCISERGRDLIPPHIEAAFANSSFLFLGYSLEDMNLKVLFRKLATYMQRVEGARHVAVQLAPHGGGQSPTHEEIALAEAQRNYLEAHFNIRRVKVYWGSCENFARELRRRLGDDGDEPSAASTGGQR